MGQPKLIKIVILKKCPKLLRIYDSTPFPCGLYYPMATATAATAAAGISECQWNIWTMKSSIEIWRQSYLM